MKKCFTFLVSIFLLSPVAPAVAEDGVAIVEFIVRHNARAQQAREVADAGYFARVLQNAKVTGTLTEKYFKGTDDKNTTDYTTTTDTTQAGTTAAITLSVPLLDSREAQERTRDMLTTVQSIRESALTIFNQLREKQITARDQSARMKELTAYVAWLQERVDAGIDYQKELYKEKIVLMKEQETLDITNAHVVILIDSLLGMVDEGSRPQLRTMLRERW